MHPTDPAVASVTAGRAVGAGAAGTSREGYRHRGRGGEEFPPAVRGHQGVRNLTGLASRHGHPG
jgi:hypothetical protein